MTEMQGTVKQSEIPVGLAPMAGITDCVFRRICFEHGCSFATTEMISAQGYMSAPKMMEAYGNLLRTLPGEGCLYAQVFGREPRWFSMAVSALTELGIFCGIDINMGCPAHKVTGGGNGSALMRDPDLCGQIVRACVQFTTLPVTVKMRLGWDEEHITCLDVARAAEQNGAAALTVHGRTRSQFYSGRADREWIGRVKRHVSIPVIANGDVDSGESAVEMLKITGCDGIAIGRAALGNPWIFDEVCAALQGRPYSKPGYAEVMAAALRQAREMAEWKGEKRAVLEMRKHFSWYIAGRRGAARLRTRINQAETMNEVEELLASLSDEA